MYGANDGHRKWTIIFQQYTIKCIPRGIKYYSVPECHLLETYSALKIGKKLFQKNGSK